MVDDEDVLDARTRDEQLDSNVLLALGEGDEGGTVSHEMILEGHGRVPIPLVVLQGFPCPPRHGGLV